jgi:hypothetical protein
VKKFRPGKERVRPYYLELVLELPARSLTSVSIQFDYAFLKWQEYPPDANHGFYMGAASISALLPVARNYTALPQDGSLIASTYVMNTSLFEYFIIYTLFDNNFLCKAHMLKFYKFLMLWNNSINFFL